jgi:hypothetical protein
MTRLIVTLLAIALFLSTTPVAQVPAHSTKLGASLFWAMRGLRDYQPQLDANLAYIKNALGADYVRIIMVLGGDEFPAPDGRRYDPWRDLALDPVTIIFENWVGRTTDYIYDNYGLKIHWTIIGSDFHSRTRANLDTYADHFATQVRGKEHKIELVEAWNEYGVNGGDVADLQYLGRRLRANLGPSLRLTLSSPNGTHLEIPLPDLSAEIGAMYAGPDFAGATVFTYHASRHTTLWRPASILSLLGPVPRYNSEPRGPGASTGGDVSDPAVLLRDYQESIAAGEAGYVYHTMPGVWGGRAYGFLDQNRWANLYDIPGSAQIATNLRMARQGSRLPQEPSSPQTPNPPLPTDPIALLMDLVRRVEVLEGIARRAGLVP